MQFCRSQLFDPLLSAHGAPSVQELRYRAVLHQFAVCSQQAGIAHHATALKTLKAFKAFLRSLLVPRLVVQATVMVHKVLRIFSASKPAPP